MSETTAIMQYIHHHMEMEKIPSWQEVSDLEEGISIVEMLHLEMLGEIIIHLGNVSSNNNMSSSFYRLQSSHEAKALGFSQVH